MMKIDVILKCSFSSSNYVCTCILKGLGPYLKLFYTVQTKPIYLSIPVRELKQFGEV